MPLCVSLEVAEETEAIEDKARMVPELIRRIQQPCLPPSTPCRCPLPAVPRLILGLACPEAKLLLRKMLRLCSGNAKNTPCVSTAILAETLNSLVDFTFQEWLSSKTS